MDYIVPTALVAGAAAYFIYHAKFERDLKEKFLDTVDEYYKRYERVAKHRKELASKLYDSGWESDEVEEEVDGILPFPELLEWKD